MNEHGQLWRVERSGGVYVEAARANKAGQMNLTRMRELLSLFHSLSLSLCHSPDCRLMDDDKRQKVHVSSLTEPHKLYYIFYIKKIVCASTLRLLQKTYFLKAVAVYRLLCRTCAFSFDCDQSALNSRFVSLAF